MSTQRKAGGSPQRAEAIASLSGWLPVLLSLLLAGPSYAAAPFWGTTLGLGTAYDSNPYLDATALPASGTAGAAALRLAIGLELDWASAAGNGLGLEYSLLNDRFLGEETSVWRLGHQLRTQLRWRLGEALALQLGLVGAQRAYLDQSAGWKRGSAEVALAWTVSDRVRGSVAYRANYASYEGGAASSEVAHQLALEGSWRVAAGMVLAPTFSATFAALQPDDAQSLTPAFGAALRWFPPGLPLSATAYYEAGFWLADAETAGLGFGANASGASTSRIDSRHSFGLELGWQLHRQIEVVAAYQGFEARSNRRSVPAYGGHSGWLGLRLRLGTGGGEGARRGGLDPRSGLRLRAQPGERSAREAAPSRRAASVASRPATRPKGSHELRVRLRHPGARLVQLVGSFNQWRGVGSELRRSDDTFSGTVVLTAGRYRFVLLVDGKVVLPPHCPRVVPDGFGGRSCQIEVP